MSPAELSKNGELFFQRLIDDAEREWARQVLSSIRHCFPKADLWTTGGVDFKYIDIRVGRKHLGKTKGSPVLFFKKLSNGKASLRLKKKYTPAGQTATFTLSSSSGEQALSTWFDHLQKHLASYPGVMAGGGHMPFNYGITTITDDEEGNEEDDDAEDISVSSLNQIFFGPPGTGKTFATIATAMRIVEPAFFIGKYDGDPGFRNALQLRFQHYLEKQQIVFCTFHQSFSYEDFVEGLRATSENGQLEYEVADGVFKELCIHAREGTPAADDPFDKAVALLLERCGDAESLPELTTVTGKKFKVAYQGNKTFRVFPEQSTAVDPYYVANMESVRKLYQGHPSKGMYNRSYVDGMLKYMKEQCELPPHVSPDNVKIKRNFVIIIDEINRGNVSRILGELITLIEEDKRAGKPEELSVVLPYSKERFSVPENVHIIGTMNTSDRSLSGIDIALRRRFTFIEKAPDHGLLDNLVVDQINLGELLSVLNQRIEVLLDRDHCIGHAYFMRLTNESKLPDLAHIFRRQIIPLLQEYFFEDWERISWVLNDHNKLAQTPPFFVESTTGEASVHALFGKKIADKIRSKGWKICVEAFDSHASFAGIISVAKSEP